MTVYHGKSAKVDFGGIIAFTTSWSVSTSADVARSTDMGDDFETFESGFDDATFTVDGNAATERNTIAQLLLEATELKCYIDATHYFHADVFCISITETANLNDIGKITYSFEMSDQDGLQYT